MAQILNKQHVNRIHTAYISIAWQQQQLQLLLLSIIRYQAFVYGVTGLTSDTPDFH